MYVENLSDQYNVIKQVLNPPPNVKEKPKTLICLCLFPTEYLS